MSYIDAFNNKKTNKVNVVSRISGKRVVKEHNIDHHFYVYDDNGKYENIYGDKLKKLSFTSASDFFQAKNRYPDNVRHESEFNPVFRVLEQQYKGIKEENPHIAFFDIETDFDSRFGYSSPADAANPIISIAVYLDWNDTSVCLAVPPETLSYSECLKVANKFDHDHVLIFNTESEMLLAFLDLIEDSDCLSTWNGNMYDIPYVVHRIQRILGRNETHRLCLWGEKPKKKIVKQQTGKDSWKEYTTYTLVGRTHLDYMDVYKNFTYESKHSYALDNIAFEELEERKLEYQGKLHELYRNDFETFIEYNIKDTMLLHRLEEQLRYLELVFGIAWSNCVLPEQVLGTVRLMEQAVTLEAHDRHMILPDVVKKRGPNKKTVGGWVYQKPGVHDWVGSIDLTSLYPSIIRSLNMSPETTIGQISNDYTYNEIGRWESISKTKTFSNWWSKGQGHFQTLEMEEYMKGSDVELKVEFDEEDGFKKIPAKDLKNLINKSDNLCISANGTIFRTDKRGVIPSLLTRWFDERVEMKNHLAGVKKILDKEVSIDRSLIKDVQKLLKPRKVRNVYSFRLKQLQSSFEADDANVISNVLNRWGLLVDDKGVVYPDNKKVWEDADKYWDKQQLIKKILLNSLYGGLLNQYFRFYDQRIGQSVTLTGRSITKHMTAKANEIIFGEYNHLGEAVAYNDTDSCVMSIAPAMGEDIKMLSTEDIINTYDAISQQVTNTFKSFMMNTFNAKDEYAQAIRCDREVVGRRMYVVTKKKYAILVIDDEGQRKDVDGKEGKYKITGLDIRRSDTPKVVQEWLLDCLKILLRGGKYKDIEDQIYKYADEYRSFKPWEMGAPKAANGVSKYMEKKEKHLKMLVAGDVKGKLTVPGHIAGAIAWNTMLDVHRDKESDRILDGLKIMFCYLKRNQYDFERISWPSDQLQLPDWFVNLPFDTEEMFQKNFIQKFYMLFRKSDINLNFKSMNNIVNDSELSDLFSKK